MIIRLFFVVAGIYSWSIASPIARDNIQPAYNAGNVQLAWDYFFILIICFVFGIACFALAFSKKERW
jgi:hypothetical protein